MLAQDSGQAPHGHCPGKNRRRMIEPQRGGGTHRMFTMVFEFSRWHFSPCVAAHAIPNSLFTNPTTYFHAR